MRNFTIQIPDKYFTQFRLRRTKKVITAKSKEFNPPLNLIRSILFLILFISLVSFDPPKTKVHSRSGNNYSVTRVVIDAGHGGHDSGCLGEKTKEKDVALAIALKLGKYIEDHFHDVKVIY